MLHDLYQNVFFPIDSVLYREEWYSDMMFTNLMFGHSSGRFSRGMVGIIDDVRYQCCHVAEHITHITALKQLVPKYISA